jgi:hypothetical protein
LQARAHRAHANDLEYPETNFCVGSATTIEPDGASVCIRAASPIACPIGVYSVRSAPV